MNIQEMHNTFRTLGQQMGMQLVRSILPESIDVYLNDAIIEKTRLELLNGVYSDNKDNTSIKASTMSVINSFKNLYKNVRYSIDTDNIDENTKVNFYNENNGFHIINIPVVDSDIILEDKEYKINPMMFLGFSVEYENTFRGSSISCRIVASDDLENTLSDYCNTASKDYPIVVINSTPFVKDSIEQNGVNSNQQLEIYTNTKNCKVKFLNIKYIKVPNIVKFDEDLSNCVNCDLSEYTHYEIIERAVMKYKASVNNDFSQN